MSSESSPSEAGKVIENPQSNFERSVKDIVDTGYIPDSLTKEIGRAEVTLAELAAELGQRAPSAQTIEKMGLLKVESNNALGDLRFQPGTESELATWTVFPGTQYVVPDESRESKEAIYYKAFRPGHAGNHAEPHRSDTTYVDAGSESKYYCIARAKE